MQTKQQIQQLLTSAGVEPNKRLGQNFLIDLNLMRLLIDYANPASGDVVLEVGCGTGSLTEGLSERAGRVIAVEIDKALSQIAKERLAEKRNVEVINADILKNKSTFNPAVMHALESARKNFSGAFLLIANLPYNAACPVIMNLVTGPIMADAMYVTVQKEVAERLTAGPGSRHYGTMSIFLALTGDLKIIRNLKPSVFWPQPQVESAMVGFVRREKKAACIKNMELLSEIINLFLQHRRKMLKACTKFAAGSLAKIDNWQDVFERCSVNATHRPEQLSPENFLAITNLCDERLKPYF